MNKSRVVWIVLIGLGGVLFAFPASHATETKSSAKNVTFNKDIAPIFFKSCAECHRPGESAPFSVLSYKDHPQRVESGRRQEDSGGRDHPLPDSLLESRW
jgi:hypothetical protein